MVYLSMTDIGTSMISPEPQLAICTMGNSAPGMSSLMMALWCTKVWKTTCSGMRSRAMSGCVCCILSSCMRASARVHWKRSRSPRHE